MDETVKPKGARATIKDVAIAAGVSPMTVSNVLNGRMQFVSPTTKKRVEREIGRLNYRRSANARNLRISEQRSIGMVIVDESPFFLADHFTCQVVAGLANVLNGADYTLTVQGMRGDQVAGSMIMRDFEVGIVYVNAGTPGAETHLPFGGWKETGNGHREAGHAAIETYTEWKSIYVDFSGHLQRAQIDNQPD